MQGLVEREGREVHVGGSMPQGPRGPRVDTGGGVNSPEGPQTLKERTQGARVKWGCMGEFTHEHGASTLGD